MGEASRHSGPVTVLLVIRHMNMGGAQRQLFHLATGLDRTRYEPVVVCLHREQPLLAELRERGVETACIAARTGLDPRLPSRIAAIARRRQARILHGYLFAANAWSRLAAMLAGNRIVVASERTVRARRRVREILVERLLARWTSAWVVNSTAVGEGLARQVPSAAGRIVRIYNGVDLGPFETAREGPGVSLARSLGLPHEAILVGVLGSLSPDKGHRHALEAIGRLADRARDVHLVLVGEGTERRAIESCSLRLGIEDRVHLLGQRDDVPTVLAGLDVLLQSSLREGMPNAVLEGMAAGLPIVATDVGGTREALADGECGVLVEPGSPAAMARAIERLLDDPEHAREIATRARAEARSRFSVERMVRDTERLYDRLLQGQARGH